jgi:hypothetical protein
VALSNIQWTTYMVARRRSKWYTKPFGVRRFGLAAYRSSLMTNMAAFSIRLCGLKLVLGSAGPHPQPVNLTLDFL